MFFSIPLDSIFYTITPMITGPFLLLVLVYFSVVRRHIISHFSLHAITIVSFAIWLIGRQLQLYGDINTAHSIMYIRFLILFSIGIPSMLIVNLLCCNITINRVTTLSAYLVGLVGSLLFIVVKDGSTLQILVDVKYGYILPLMITDTTYSDVLIFVTLILLVIPNSYLIYHQLIKKEKKVPTLLFLIHSLVFGLSFIGGELSKQFWPLYIVSYLTVSCWYWIIYQDIKKMKTQTKKLKNELQQILTNKEKESISADVFTFHQNTNEIDLVKTNDPLETSPNNGIRPTKRNKELIDKAINYIENHYHEDIELSEIALHSNVSDSYLIRTFKKVMGETPHQYITNYRIQLAQDLLKEHSVNETSIAVGFKNYSYFSTLFKKVTGLSPLQYQKKLLGKK
ncbi:AraC family transcriptional regulator [Colwellia sp. RE-S-Sl-9]